LLSSRCVAKDVRLTSALCLSEHARRRGFLAAQLPKGFGRNVSGSNKKEDSSGGGSERPKSDGKDAKSGEKKSFWGASSKSEGGKGVGLGGSGGKKDDFDYTWLASALGVGGIALYLLLNAGRINGKEISWQEFRNQVLAAGLVDHLEIVNKDHVRIFLRSTPDPEFVHAAQSLEGISADESLDRAALRGGRQEAGGPPTLFFRIGSVETFERQLEDAQIDLHIRPRNFVLVRHKTETDLGTRLTSLLPALFMLGLYVGGFMLVSGMMGGGPGGGKEGLNRIFSIGKAKAAVYSKDSKVKVRLSTAGCSLQADVPVGSAGLFVSSAPPRYIRAADAPAGSVQGCRGL
jgi:AFG3 family protein